MKPHLFFRNPLEGVEKFRQRVRNPGILDAEDEEKNYDPLKEDFIRCRDSYLVDRDTRVRRRNLALNIPAHIEFIEIHFFDSFNSGKFENIYRTRFGIAPVLFKEFNSVGVFAVLDSDIFTRFLIQFELFINTDNHIADVPYDNLIKFIKEFYFLTTERILEYSELRSYVVLDIIRNPELYRSHTIPIETRLREYLTENAIEFKIDSENERIELINIQNDRLHEIVDNFDIIHTVNSYSAGIIRPSEFNTPIREFGFTISNYDEDLPLIGIIDTGISNGTPLASLIINEGNEFDITGTSPTLDEVNHGTAVASMAALGERLIPDHVGNLEADARLLSIKVMNGVSQVIKISDVESLIREANRVHNCKIFTLTILFEQPLMDNANVSEYASMLDKLTDELNILIIISAGNTDIIQNTIPPQTINYPHHFSEEIRNICSPADSMNNLVVGATAENFENNGSLVLAADTTFPASYTRRFNLGAHRILNSKRKSKHLFKPDIALPGGDFNNEASTEHTGIKVISTQTGIFFDRRAGTSLSTPLAANMAAKLLRIYPSLGNNMQSIKALIVNSASLPNFGNVFHSVHFDPQKLIGKGLADNYQCLFSDENSVTLLLEDTIRPSELHEYLLNTPEYLHDLPHKRGVIEITATLCYKIRPFPELHISYCPVCISFGFFNNKKINNELSNEIKLKTSITWSEDYYFGTKLLSNCQKLNFRLDKVPLDRENNTIKIALNCKTHKLLNQIQKDSLNYDMPFSLAINIKEIPQKGNLTGNLYSELEAINTLEAIATLDADLENVL